MAIPQKKPSGFSFENAVFYLSLLILAGIIGGFFYLNYAIGKGNDQLAAASIEAATAKTQEQKDLKNQVAAAQQKLNDYSKILDDHRVGTEFFNKLEALVLPDIYFLKCDLDLAKLTADFSGRAKTFKSLGQQIMIFESAGDIIASANLDKASINDKGSIDFSVKININPVVVTFK